MDDLESISSLGFRGEALPSIASAAQVEVITSTGIGAGSYINIKEGDTIELRSEGRARGTTITVRNLLRNVPARLKFLKSPATENSHIANVVSQYALAYPEVRFTLTSEGRTVLHTPGSGRLLDSISEVYGQDTARDMLELGNGEPQWQSNSGLTHVMVTGMTGSPGINRSGRDYISFFVNRRWINSKLLTWAVEEAYHGLLMTGRHPVAVINISIAPGEVDVNIHPTKSEVKFRDERLVFGAVQRAVRQALIAQAPVPGIEEMTAAYETPAPPPHGTVNHSNNQVRSSFWPPSAISRPADRSGGSGTPGPAWMTPGLTLPALRLLGQLAASYIVAEGPEGLYLIDQHAAHERIIFEKISQQSAGKGVEVQGLLEAAMFEVTPRQDGHLKVRYLELAEFGFTIEPFGERSYLVRALPLLLHDRDWAAALKELLDGLEIGGDGDWREKMMISFACHGAIKAGQVLSDDEMREMLRQLEQTAIPNSCPHGRPTMIRLSSAQLEKEFHRT
jgi:DNA mismatch repair protein MutL